MEVELDEVPKFGFKVEVTAFKEDGWEERPTKTWYSKGMGDETLAQFLASFARLPGSEATELADQLQGPWRDEWLNSGGEEELRSFARLSRWGVPAILLIVLLALISIPLLVWLVLTQV